MSKTSNKARYAQLMEWMSTLSKQRDKRVKQQQSRMEYYEQQHNR